MKKGITVAGSVLVDKLNAISAYPSAGELTQILSVGLAAGGCVPNVAVDVKKLYPAIPVYASGKIGDDEEGVFVKNELKSAGVDVSAVVIDQTEKTSFTDVMSVKGGERTFFTYAGASAKFGFDDVFAFDMSEMLHLGYFLLLKKIDDGDGLKILKEAKARGVKTSIDLVSENSDRYSLIIPCLEYTDNLIVNEIEAGKLAGISNPAENLRAVAERLTEYGVKERVVIHLPEKGVCYHNGIFTEVNSLELPAGYIKGSTGAGDAFCAGVLAGIYNGYSDERILTFASLAAAASLRAEDATSGLVAESELYDEFKNFKRKK